MCDKACRRRRQIRLGQYFFIESCLLRSTIDVLGSFRSSMCCNLPLFLTLLQLDATRRIFFRYINRWRDKCMATLCQGLFCRICAESLHHHVLLRQDLLRGFFLPVALPACDLAKKFTCFNWTAQKDLLGS